MWVSGYGHVFRMRVVCCWEKSSLGVVVMYLVHAGRGVLFIFTFNIVFTPYNGEAVASRGKAYSGQHGDLCTVPLDGFSQLIEHQFLVCRSRFDSVYLLRRQGGLGERRLGRAAVGAGRKTVVGAVGQTVPAGHARAGRCDEGCRGAAAGEGGRGV